MQALTMVMLIVVTVVLAGTAHHAAAETLSPIQQLRDGVPADHVQCDDGKILMLSPSGNPACVFSPPCMLELRGFVQADKPHHITCKELRENFGIRIVTDPDEIPPPLGNGRFAEFLSNYETGLDHQVVIKPDGLGLPGNLILGKFLETDLGHKIGGGKANIYLGFTGGHMLFLLKDVDVKNTVNITVPYTIFPPFTPQTAIGTMAIVNGITANIVSPDKTFPKAVVQDQTSTAQVFSFELTTDTIQVIEIIRGYPLEVRLEDHHITRSDEFYRHMQHPGDCEENLIPVPSQDGSLLCIKPMMMEFILTKYGISPGESAYRAIAEKYREHACVSEFPVLLTNEYQLAAKCATRDAAIEHIKQGNRPRWMTDYDLLGGKYQIGCIGGVCS